MSKFKKKCGWNDRTMRYFMENYRKIIDYQIKQFSESKHISESEHKTQYKTQAPEPGPPRDGEH